MLLTLQIVLLIIGVGGAIVTALTLSDSRTKLFTVSGFGVLGLIGLALTVLTYNQVTLTEAISSLGAALQALWGYVYSIIQRRSVQILFAALIGIAIGVIGPFAYDKLKVRKWYSSYDVLRLAAPDLLAEVAASEAEVHLLSLRIMDIQEERKKYHVPFGSSPVMAPESEAMEAFRKAIVEASTKSAALNEVRDRANRKAGDELYEQLKTGKLIARGFVSPAGSKSREVTIPAGQWKLLKFNNNLTEAASDSFRYIGIEIARA